MPSTRPNAGSQAQIESIDCSHLDLGKHRWAERLLAVALVSAASLYLPTDRALATCPVPNQITNGHPADATAVMGNFNALGNCATSTSGSPTSGSISVFSGPSAVTSGNLTGDVTTSGSTSTSLVSSGVSPGSYTNANITVDSKGRVTAAANGFAVGGGGLVDFAVVKKTADQTGNFTSGFTNIGWNSEQSDPGGYHDDAVNNERLTITTAGVYEVGGFVSFVSPTLASSNYARFSVSHYNSSGTLISTIMTTINEISATPTVTLGPSWSHPIVCSAGDYFVLAVNVEADTSVSVQSVSSWFSIKRWS